MEDREALIEDAPEIYDLTDYYRKHPLVLARLSRFDEGSLRVSWRLTVPKAPTARVRHRAALLNNVAGGP